MNSLSINSEQQIKQFYDAVAEVAKKQGYILDFKKEKAYPSTKNGERISKRELIKRWGHLRDVPSGNWYFEYFLTERENYEQKEMISMLMRKNYNIKCNFGAEDVILGNVVVKIDDKWFAIGECRNEGECETRITEIWPLKYVISNLNRLRVQLKYSADAQKNQGFNELDYREKNPES